MRKLVERIRQMTAWRNKIKRTNLRREDPGPRAVIRLPQEPFEFESELPIVGGKFSVKGGLFPDSSLSRTVTVVMLVGIGCACTITFYLVGVPAWISAPSILLPSAIFGLYSRTKRQ